MNIFLDNMKPLLYCIAFFIMFFIIFTPISALFFLLSEIKNKALKKYIDYLLKDSKYFKASIIIFIILLLFFICIFIKTEIELSKITHIVSIKKPLKFSEFFLYSYIYSFGLSTIINLVLIVSKIIYRKSSNKYLDDIFKKHENLKILYNEFLELYSTNENEIYPKIDKLIKKFSIVEISFLKDILKKILDINVNIFNAFTLSFCFLTVPSLFKFSIVVYYYYFHDKSKKEIYYIFLELFKQEYIVVFSLFVLALIFSFILFIFINSFLNRNIFYNFYNGIYTISELVYYEKQKRIEYLENQKLNNKNRSGFLRGIIYKFKKCFK